MKKNVVFFLVALLLVTLLAVPAMAAGSCYMAGPDVVRAGDTVTVTFYAGGGIYGGSGSVSFDSSLLTLQGYTPKLGGNWAVEFSGNSFVFYDNSMSTPLNGTAAIFSATFQVGAQVAPGTSLSISANNVVLSDGQSDQAMGSAGWSKTVAAPLNDNANLESLTVAGYDLYPDFNPNVVNYNFSVPYETTKLSVSAKTQDPNAKVSVTGVTLAENATNKVVVTVTAENGATKEYVILVWRPQDPNYEPSGVNTLAELSVENFLISPAFAPEKMDYAVFLPNEVESIQVSAKPTDGKAKVELPAIENIPVGKSTYEIVVTAENEDVRIYTITTFRAEPFLGPNAVPEEPTEPAEEPTTAPTTEPTEAPTEPTEATTVPTTAPVVEKNGSNNMNGILWILSVVAAFLGGLVVPMLIFKKE